MNLKNGSLSTGADSNAWFFIQKGSEGSEGKDKPYFIRLSSVPTSETR
jgi:hypothetical protein